MNITLPYRSAQADRLFISGWVGLAVTGQALIPVTLPSLEWVSLAWLLTGLFMVRRGTGLPLLLLSCPVFLCEPHRAWAWAQSLAALVLLVRLLIDRQGPRRDLLWIALTGSFVAWASWPVEAGTLLFNLRAFSPRELATQWLMPQGPWAIFPFRQTADRAMVAMLCAALILGKSCFNTPRIWRALWGGGLLAVGVSLLSALLPWHTPHRFLGTSNFSSYGPYLLHGAGYNACYLPLILAAALPWLMVPLTHRRHWIHLGFAGLLPPLYFLLQRSLSLLVVTLLLATLVLVVQSTLTPKLRHGWRNRRRHLRDHRLRMFALLTLCLGLSGTWAFKMGAADPASPLRQTLRYAIAHKGNPKPTAPAYGHSPESATTGNTLRQHSSQPAWPLRLQSYLARFDPARAHMWTLGLQHAVESGLWRGEGAGTWAAFHRAQPKPSSLYFAHLHNTYLDLIFEYGLIPMVCLFACITAGLLRLFCGATRLPRAWLLYFAGMAAVAMGQHLLYSFTTVCLLIPGSVILAKTARNS